MPITLEKLAEGTGPVPQRGRFVSIHYTGWLSVGGTNGEKFDCSRERGEPLRFVFGARQVISGWEMALARMRVGDRARVVIAPELAYGRTGFADIVPPDSTLIFEMELLAVE